MAVVFSTGAFSPDTAAVRFGADGKLALLDAAGQAGPLMFGLDEMDEDALAQLAVRPLAGARAELRLVSDDGEARLVQTISPGQGLRPHRGPGGIFLLLTDDDQEVDIALHEPGLGWVVDREFPAGSLVAADAELFQSLYGSLLLPVVATPGPRSRPSGLAERLEASV